MSHRGRSHWREEQEAAIADLAARHHRQQLRAQTPGQAIYLEALGRKRIVVCVGNAGTGKSWMSCGHGAHLLLTGQVQKLVLTRPLVQCGHGYGFLPGEKSEKIAPFFRPLLDILSEFISEGEIQRKVHDGSIELLPLEDMRGTTLKSTYLVCDEAQNAHYHQLHMLLTRLGPGSRFVVCGDVSRTQIDIQHRGPNPLAEVVRRLDSRANPQVEVVRLTRKDIVRDGLVQWVDEVLGEPEEENGGEWLDLTCPSCKEKLWYDDGADHEPSAEAVRCFGCGRVVVLWDGEEFSPRLGQAKSPRETFPDRP